MTVENRITDQTGRFQYCVQADGTAAILCCLERVPELRIPEYLDNIKVTALLDGAIELEDFETVYIPMTVSKIEEDAFMADNIKEVVVDKRNPWFRTLDGVLLVNEEPDFMDIFLKNERQRIDAIADTEESFREWYTHYATLTPKQQALAGYLLTTAKKDSYADDYMGLQLCPVSCVDQKNVNNGYGIMFSICRECFPQEDGKFVYLRSDMWIPPHHDFAQIPDWIRFMEDEIRQYSSGLSEVQTEVIPCPFEEDGYCYTITFRLDPAAVRECIFMFGERWDTKEIGQYIFSLTDITGEFGYVIGIMEEEKIISLWEADMYFK